MGKFVMQYMNSLSGSLQGAPTFPNHAVLHVPICIMLVFTEEIK
jgi:hypothetical protein